MTLKVVDNPPDRPEWLRETIRLLVDATTIERDRLLDRVARAPEERVVEGSDDDWGLGQVATHLLIVERGVALIGLRLAQAAAPGPTGQPRPAAGGVSRAGIRSPGREGRGDGRPPCRRVPRGARHDDDGPAPVLLRRGMAAEQPGGYGDLNCFGWLLMLPNHYRAHLEALDRGTASAL